MLQRVTAQTYLLPVNNGRSFGELRCTPHTLALKQIRDNTSPIALNYLIVLPTLLKMDEELRSYVHEGKDVSAEDLFSIIKRNASASLISYADRFARFGVQTAVACALIQLHRPYTDSMVYLWEMYPRFFQHYMQGIAITLHIPRFLIRLLGSRPLPSEAVFIEAHAPIMAVLEDSVKRNSIVLVGDVVIDTVRVLANPSTKNKSSVVVKNALMRAASTTCCVTGATLGRVIGGHHGEFWGEFMGLMLAPLVTLRITNTLIYLSHDRRRGRPHAQR